MVPTEWLPGRVVEVYPGQDDLVYVVSVNTARGVYWLKSPFWFHVTCELEPTSQHFSCICKTSILVCLGQWLCYV